MKNLLRCALLLVSVCAGAAAAGDWGGIEIDTTGHQRIVMENSVIQVVWGKKTFKDGAENFVINGLFDKRDSTDQGGADQIEGVWMAYGVGRGRLNAARVTYSGPDRQTAHLEWDGGKVVQEFSLYPDRPVLRIDYLKYGVNVVDIGAPGGQKDGTYCFYGAERWQQERLTITDTTFRRKPNPHELLTDDLYPVYPNPIYFKPWDAHPPLCYRGWFILGVYDPDTGSGYGRIMPGENIDIIKLLWSKGFELFPHFGREHAPFSGYLFVVRGGRDEILSLGMKLVDEQL